MPIRCPSCNSDKTITKGGAKWIREGNIYRRNKICGECKIEFKTIEAIMEDYQEATELASAFVRLIKKHLLINE